MTQEAKMSRLNLLRNTWRMRLAMQTASTLPLLFTNTRADVARVIHSETSHCHTDDSIMEHEAGDDLSQVQHDQATVAREGFVTHETAILTRGERRRLAAEVKASKALLNHVRSLPLALPA